MGWPEHLPKPNLFLIGGAKCGTTTLATYLASQREICWSVPKEPWFFCQRDMAERCAPLKTMEWYARCFSHWRGEEVLGEGSVSYYVSRYAIEEILYFNENARFILILRDPLDMFVSLHRQMLYNKQESVISFERAWILQEKRRYGVGIPSKCENINFLMYREWVDWTKIIKRLFASAKRDRILLLFFDDVVEHPEKVEEKLRAFLGVDLESGLGKIHENARGDPKAWSVRLDDGLAFLQRYGLRFLGHMRRYLPVDSKNKEKVPERRLRVIAEDLRESLMELAGMMGDPRPRQWARRCAEIARG